MSNQSPILWQGLSSGLRKMALMAGFPCIKSLKSVENPVFKPHENDKRPAGHSLISGPDKGKKGLRL
jgi:hypothetical protein